MASRSYSTAHSQLLEPAVALNMASAAITGQICYMGLSLSAFSPRQYVIFTIVSSTYYTIGHVSGMLALKFVALPTESNNSTPSVAAFTSNCSANVSSSTS